MGNARPGGVGGVTVVLVLVLVLGVGGEGLNRDLGGDGG